MADVFPENLCVCLCALCLPMDVEVTLLHVHADVRKVNEPCSRTFVRYLLTERYLYSCKMSNCYRCTCSIHNIVACSALVFISYKVSRLRYKSSLPVNQLRHEQNVHVFSGLPEAANTDRNRLIKNFRSNYQSDSFRKINNIIFLLFLFNVSDS